ncbi:MAG: hypothetical protein ABIY90_08630 [Puia sp.]
MKNLFLLIMILALGACAPSRNAPVSVVQDGSSFETAIVINETSESAGIRAEYRWIKEHYSGYKVKRQSQPNFRKRPYDVIQIQFSDDRVVSLYFDISHYYGKL